MTNQIFDQPVEVSSDNANASNLDALELLSEQSNTAIPKCRSLPGLSVSSQTEVMPKCGSGTENDHKPSKPEISFKPSKPHKPIKPEMTKEPEKGKNPENHHKPVNPELTEKPEKLEKQKEPGLEKTKLDASSAIAELLMDGSIDAKDEGLLKFAHSQANEEAGYIGEIRLLDQINQQLENNHSPYRLRAGQSLIKMRGARRLELIHQEARREIGSDNEVIYQGVVDSFDFAILDHQK